MKQPPEKKPTNNMDTPPETDASLLPNEENRITTDPNASENTLLPTVEQEEDTTNEDEKGVTEEDEFAEDPEYLEILLSYTKEDLKRMDMDPDEAEDQYTGYEMEE